MVHLVRRRNARTLVSYSWDDETGQATRRFEGAGGPPSSDEVFHGRCYVTPEEKAKIRRYL